MAQNHYVTKTKRRPKNSNRKDPAAATMAKLRERAAAEAKRSGKYLRTRGRSAFEPVTGQLQYERTHAEEEY